MKVDMEALVGKVKDEFAPGSLA